MSFSRQDLLWKSCEKKPQTIKENAWRNKILQPPSHQQVCFVCLVQIEIFAFEMHLQIDIFTGRALEDETCSFSKKTKIASCFCPYFSILARKEPAIGTRLSGKCQAGEHPSVQSSIIFVEASSGRWRINIIPSITTLFFFILAWLDSKYLSAASSLNCVMRTVLSKGLIGSGAAGGAMRRGLQQI